MEATVQVHCAVLPSDLNSLQGSPIPVSASCHPHPGEEAIKIKTIPCFNMDQGIYLVPIWNDFI